MEDVRIGVVGGHYGISSESTLKGMDKGRNCLWGEGRLEVSPVPATPYKNFNRAHTGTSSG